MNNEKWLKHYRTNKSAIWIKMKLTNGSEFYIDQHESWMGIKALCEQKSCFFEELSLQFRSHEVKIDLEDADGVYLIRSILGRMGGESRHFYTVGILKDKEVHKTMWCIPELVEEKSYIDDIESCFEEAMIYNEEKKKENR